MMVRACAHGVDRQGIGGRRRQGASVVEDSTPLTLACNQRQSKAHIVAPHPHLPRSHQSL